MNTNLPTSLLAFGLAFSTATAQEFAIDPGGFVSADTSTDGTFAVSGTFISATGDPMSGGAFSITGEFVSLIAAVPPTVPPTDAITTIFDNISGEDNGLIGATDTLWLASKFCLGSQPYDLESVSLLLNSQDSNGQPGPPSTVRLQIYSNDPESGKPSVNTGLIMNLSGLTNPITPPQGGRGLVKWTNATPFKLAANACYWLVLSRENGGYIGQTLSVTKPTGPAGAFGRTQSADAGATWEAPGNFNSKMLIQGTASGPPLDAEELIVNGSFENTQDSFVRDSFGLMSLPASSSAIPGWTTTTAELAWVDNANTFGAATPFGKHSLELTGYHDGQPYGGVSQTIPTVPGQAYRLSLALGSNADYPGAGGQKSVSVCVGSVGTILTLAPTNTTGNQWETFRFNFTANSASTEVVIAGVIASGNYLGLDNVSVRAEDSAIAPDQGNLVANGSFEFTDCPFSFAPDGSGIMSLQLGANNIRGWTTTNAELAWGINGNAYGPRSPYGSLFLDLTGYHDAPPYGGITQTLATTPGQTYRLSFALGSHEDNSAYRGPMGLEVNVGSVSQSFTFTPTGTGSQWGTFTLDFTAESMATPLTFRGTLSTGGAYLGLDNISVIPALEVPRAAVVSVSLNELKARFPVEAGRTYTVESREDLSVGEWLAVPNTTRSNAGASFEVSLPFRASQPQRYYRVRQVR